MAGPQRAEEFQKAWFQIAMASADGMIRVRADTKVLRSCRGSLSYDRMGFSSCRENLRHHSPALTDDSAVVTSRRTSLTSARTRRMDDRPNPMRGKTNLRRRRVNLRHRHPSQTLRRTLRMDDRRILSYDRNPRQPGKTGKTIRHGAESSVLAQNDPFRGGISSETDFSTDSPPPPSQIYLESPAVGQPDLTIHLNQGFR